MSSNGFGIEIDYKGIQFNLEFFHSTTDKATSLLVDAGNEDGEELTTDKVTSLLVGVGNEDGEELNLVDDVLSLIIDGADKFEINSSLTTIILYGGNISYRNDPASKQFGIRGGLGWRPEIDFGGEIFTLKIEAFVDLIKDKPTDGSNSILDGTISGAVETSIPGIEFLKLGVGYNFGKKEIFFKIGLGKYGIQAAHKKNEIGDVKLEFGLTDMPSLTLGEVVTFFAALVDPSIDEYEFEPPWDFLSKIDLKPILTSLTLTLELKANNKEKVFGIKINNLRNLVPDELKPFVESFFIIRSVELNYSSGKTSPRKKQTSITVDGDLLGSPKKLKWDPVNGSPPVVPGKGPAVFELRYLGFGQRVAFKDAATVNNIGEVMGLLRGALSEAEQRLITDRSLSVGNPSTSFLGASSPIKFNSEAAWLIGMDVSLLKALNLSLIFNDPFITGIRIELYGKMAKSFAGLKFEMLYQRINETTGKYHVELVLPDFVRHFTIGAVSITLPTIVVDVFTNGDFKLDLGFPWDFNFARSFSIEFLPFIGAGGLYFNKLSAATATSTPALKPGGGEFTPVYEFGVGLRIGLGKSINKGPLKAEFSISLLGMIEGVFAYYNPPSQGDRSLYYAIKGGISIVGRLYGEVDFEIIKIKIEVTVKVSLVLQLAAYQPIHILIAAEVTVEATVEVLFIEVSFEFSHEIEAEFTIDSPDGPANTAPWYPNLID